MLFEINITATSCADCNIKSTKEDMLGRVLCNGRYDYNCMLHRIAILRRFMLKSYHKTFFILNCLKTTLN